MYPNGPLSWAGSLGHPEPTDSMDYRVPVVPGQRKGYGHRPVPRSMDVEVVDVVVDFRDGHPSRAPHTSSRHEDRDTTAAADLTSLGSDDTACDQRSIVI